MYPTPTADPDVVTDEVKEHDPFHSYFDSLNPKIHQRLYNIQGIRSAFGYTGTMDSSALKVKHKYNSQGILVETKKKTTRFKNDLLNQREDTLKEVAPIIDSMKVKKLCYFCKQHYQPIHNYGTWKCFYHPEPGISLIKYTCCGRRKEAHTEDIGCTPCDHQSICRDRSQRWKDPIVVDIPIVAAIQMKIPETSYTTTSNEKISLSRAHVHRVSNK
jgi:hypothetical protein